MSSLTTQPASNQPMLPSEVVEPHRVNTPPQQGSTQPDDGHHAHPNRTDDNVIMPAARDESRVAQEGAAAQEGGRPPKFAEQVIGYAQKTRGAVLGKESLKEHGQQILQGQADAREEVPKA